MLKRIMHPLQNYSFCKTVQMLNRPTWSPDFSPIENIWRIKRKNRCAAKKIQDCWADQMLYQTRKRQLFSPKTAGIGLHFLDLFGFLKEKMLHSGKHSAFLRSDITLKTIFLKMLYFISLKKFMCSVYYMWIKCGFTGFWNHGFLFLFTIYTASWLFWIWSCTNMQTYTHKHTHTNTVTVLWPSITN